MHRLVSTRLALVCLAGCSGGGGGGSEGLRLDTIPLQHASVGSPLDVSLSAQGGHRDRIEFAFSSSNSRIEGSGVIRPRGDGQATFSWSPSADDVGMHTVEFSVTDGDGMDRQSARIEVLGAGDTTNAPVFVQPAGTGTTLDLDVNLCLDVDIEVTDPNDDSVAIEQGQPRIDTAVVQQSGPMRARWHWCPTQQEIDAQDRYQVSFVADDGSSPRVTKDFEVDLLRPTRSDCPGTPPAITHTPANQTTVLPIRIEAQVNDPEGLKGSPMLYHSTTRPADPPVLTTMTQIGMSLASGDPRMGSWTANVPNPVASSASGASATVYYVIVAQDDDDPMGSCDHRTQSPARMAYEMTVTSGGGGATLGPCASCTADSQCGDGDDNCIHVGTTSGSWCARSCASSSDCPSGYTCSTSAVTSVSGASARQCVPLSGSCTSSGGGTTACTDSWEPNDTRLVAAGRSSLSQGTTSNLKICPLAGGTAYEEDWFRVEVGTSSQVSVGISGGTGVDIDLQLVGSTGDSLGQSTSLTATENVSACVSAGTYYLRVYGWLPAGSTATMSNTYSLTWSASSSSCGGGGGGTGAAVCDGTCPTWLDYAGTCDAGVLQYCDGGRVVCQTCASGTSCGYDAASGWYACQADSSTPTCGGSCGTVDFAGTCSGNELRWCDGTTLQCSDCGSNVCQYDSAHSYYACMTSTLACGSTCPWWLDNAGTCETSTSLKYCGSDGNVACQTCSAGETCGWDYTNSWYACMTTI